MKKITQCLLLLWGFTAFAQFPESFETTVPPAGWASFRGTNDLGTEFDWSVSTAAVFVQEGIQSAFVRYEAVTGGLAEDWLVSPMHTVTAPNTLLTFYQRQQYTLDYGTTYDIRVSTTSQTDHATFTTVLSQTEADLNITTMTVKSVDLSAYEGQSIYIAFVMTNNDGDNWAIDNVNMESSVAAPDCTTVISPADNAMDVPVGTVTFAWNAPTTGDAPTSYDFYYGIDPGDVTTLLGNYTTTSVDVNIADFNFTFYWKIVPKNLGGSAVDCPIWTFTTQEPPGFCLNAPAGQWPTEAYTPETCDGLTENIITENGYAGEYSVVNVTSGETYIFSSGTTDFITLSSDAGATATSFGVTPLTWVADVTGEVRFYSHVDDQCATEDVDRVRSVVCGVVTEDFPDYVNLQFPYEATINQNGSATVYARIYEGGLTDTTTGQAPGITAWIGISPEGENTNPNTWTNWVLATFNVETDGNNNDEYQAEIGAGLTPGTYYYASRFRLNNGDFAYGGTNFGFWDGTTYLSGVLTVNEAIFEGCLNDPNGLYPDATFTPACLGSDESITTLGYSGEYSNLNLTTGTEYTFSSSIASDRVTIGNEDGTVVLAYGITPLTWTSTVTGVVRFYVHDDNACSASTTFRARIVSCGTPPPTPENDECTNAIALTAGSVFGDFPLSTTNFGATINATDPLPTCGAFNFETSGKDVWYSITVPASGTLTIETQGDGGLGDTVIEVYIGTCGALTLVDCNDDANDAYSILELSGLENQSIFIRVWGYNGSQGSFVLSAFDASLSAASFDNSNFSYYPNPVKDMLNLSYIANISKVSVVNLLGQQMITSEMNANQGQIDMSTLAAGTYLVKITTQDSLEKTIKVIKQ
jgi:hypothetical protein